MSSTCAFGLGCEEEEGGGLAARVGVLSGQ